MYTWTVPFACLERARESERERAQQEPHGHACTHTGIHGRQRKTPGKIEGGEEEDLKEKKRKFSVELTQL